MMKRLVKGVGYDIHEGADCVSLVIEPGSGGAELDYPFKVTVQKATSGYDVYVRAGTCNNFVPKISSTYLDADTPPKLNFTSVGSGGKKIVALKVTKDGVKFFPSTVEVVVVDNEEAIQNTDTNGYLQLASITCKTDGGLRVSSINQFVYSSQVVTRVKPGSDTAAWTFTSR